jgi:hypothetical protein
MGVVYFFRENGREEVKIGMSENNFIDRLESMKTYCPNGVNVVGIIKTDNPKSLEKKLHLKFKHRHVSREFYRLTDKEVISIISEYDNGAYEFYQLCISLCDEIGVSVKEAMSMFKEYVQNIKALKNNEYSEIQNQSLITEIMSYMFTHRIKSLETDIKGISSILNNQKTNSEIRKVLKANGFHPSKKPKYINCTVTNTPKTCRAYKITT